MNWNFCVQRIGYKQVLFGTEIPKRWGIAWTEPNSLQHVLMPIPLNLIARVLQRVYWVGWRWLKYRQPDYVSWSVAERMISEARTHTREQEEILKDMAKKAAIQAIAEMVAELKREREKPQ